MQIPKEKEQEEHQLSFHRSRNTLSGPPTAWALFRKIPLGQTYNKN
jgi:hypothetical protein